MQFLPLTFAIAAGSSAAVTPLVRRLARDRGLLDEAHELRKIHGRPVPRVGGVAIVLCSYVACALALATDAVRGAIGQDLVPMLCLAAAGLGVAAVGFYDDLRGTGATTKLAVQIAAALILYAGGFRADDVETPFGIVSMGFLALPATVLWVCAVSNALNLIDGLDGLAGGVAVAGGLAALAIALHADNTAAALAAAAVVGAAGGFLVYNVHPASIFMGDTGSLFLGAILAALPLWPSATDAPVALPAAIVALLVPLADTVAAILRRLARGTPVFTADREHLHHRLLAAGLSHRRAAIVLWVLASALAAAGFYVATGTAYRGAVLMAVLASAPILLCATGMLPFPTATLAARRQQNVARLRALRSSAARLQRTARLAEVQAEVVSAAEAIGVTAAWATSAANRALAPSRAVDIRGAHVRALMALDPGRPQLGSLDVSWDRTGSPADGDLEIAVDLLRQHVSSAVARLEGDEERRADGAAPAPLAVTGGPSPARRASGWPP